MDERGLKKDSLDQILVASAKGYPQNESSIKLPDIVLGKVILSEVLNMAKLGINYLKSESEEDV